MRQNQYSAASGDEPRTALCSAEIWSKKASPPLSKRRRLCASVLVDESAVDVRHLGRLRAVPICSRG
jgi:hypothetical protein